MVSVKIAPHNIPETIEYLKAKYKKFTPSTIFHYEFLDDKIDAFYKNDKNVAHN